MIDETVFYGNYIVGCGRASIVGTTQERRNLLSKHFGNPLCGTFNIQTTTNNKVDYVTIKDGIHRYNLIALEAIDDSIEYGWSYKWSGSKMLNNRLEIYTRKLLPNIFKNGLLKITFYRHWSESEIRVWEDKQYWFQNHQWLKPEHQRANSALVWSYMKNIDYVGKTVLDIGAHGGYYSFRAAQAGSRVIATDIQEKAVNKATTINNHIEMCDVKFNKTKEIPNKYFDIIFCLSVYHWISKKYDGLEDYITMLKNKCGILFLELINPSIEGDLTKKDVDGIIKKLGGFELLHYRHKIRRTRTLYQFNNDK